MTSVGGLFVVGLLASCGRLPSPANATNALAVAAPPAVTAPVSIPFVGCASDGQLGPRAAPTGAPVTMTMDPAVAAKLAYYSAGDPGGVLAPKGWNCFGTYGSNGSNLFVAPAPILSTDVLSDTWAAGNGDAVEAAWSSGDTSGRFEVAKVIERAFPSHAAFAKGVIDEGIEPATDFPRGAYPTDTMTARADTVAEYLTPANVPGLGTADSRLTPSVDPIRGVAILQGQTPDLAFLAVKLPDAERDLAAAVVARFEAEASQPPSSPTVTANSAPAAPPPAAPAIDQGSGDSPALDVVRQFYAALGNDDGGAASGLVVPEKRAVGAFSAASLSRFYGSMREPVRLVSASESMPGSVLARYHYAAAGGRTCDGSASITVVNRAGQSLIAGIHALNGC
jgi:hypothetical protein